mmetsp:Transcript_8934/g.24785  ORF Transcript_8934/g.24785 Transcript_8934/m.24785 type:complete len:462 (-) Transcript_8934:75-1460(-)
MPPSAQVEVQAPPGLEMTPGSTSHGGGAANSALATDPEFLEERARMQAAAEKEMKAQLVREVTEAVREHIDWKTSAAVDTLWQRGQRAMLHLQQEQTTQSEQLRGQLAACAESYRSLERENAALRCGLEALMKHLTMMFGPPPHLQQPPLFPQPSPAPVVSPPPAGASQELRPAPTAQPSTPVASAAAGRAGPPKPSTASARSETEDFHTPAASPQRVFAAEELPSAPQSTATQLPQIPRFPGGSASDAATDLSAGVAVGASHEAAAAVATSASSGGTGSEPAELPELSQAAAAAATTTTTAPSSQTPAVLSAASTTPAQAFTLTLRRADNVPLGLDVRGDATDTNLIVKAVRPGGAIEAWNRQCAGDAREIRTGDRIILINGAEDAESMREQCLTKHLLKMTVLREPPAPPVAVEERLPAATAPAALERSASGLRADANEFVPQVGTWLGYAGPPGTTSC